MIVRRLAEIENTGRDVAGTTWRSRRLLRADDRQPYSLHDTIVRAGTETDMWYQHHVEAVYCVAGSGVLVDREAGTEHEIADGTLYLLDGHERHTLRAHTEMRVVCVFTPPLIGSETHDGAGGYPPTPHDGTTSR